MGSDLVYDALVLGGGPAGLAAAVQLARFNRSVLVFDGGGGRSSYHQVNHNYLGFPGGISIRDFRRASREQAARLPVAFIDEEAAAVSRQGSCFVARTAAGIQANGRTVVFATGAFVMAPWVGHNLYRFNQPVTLSYGLAGVLTQANCDKTYEGEYLGYWHPDCSFLDETIGPSAQQCLRTPARCAEIYGARFGDESDAAKLGQQEGLDYISAHRGRVPVVVAARVGRIWGLFRPGQQVRIDAVGEGRPLWVSRAALITFYELVAVGVVWRRKAGRTSVRQTAARKITRPAHRASGTSRSARNRYARPPPRVPRRRPPPQRIAASCSARRRSSSSSASPCRITASPAPASPPPLWSRHPTSASVAPTAT